MTSEKTSVGRKNVRGKIFRPQDDGEFFFFVGRTTAPRLHSMFPTYKTRRSQPSGANLAANEPPRTAAENAINPETGFAPRHLRTSNSSRAHLPTGALCSGSIDGDVRTKKFAFSCISRNRPRTPSTPSTMAEVSALQDQGWRNPQSRSGRATVVPRVMRRRWPMIPGKQRLEQAAGATLKFKLKLHIYVELQVEVTLAGCDRRTTAK